MRAIASWIAAATAAFLSTGTPSPAAERLDAATFKAFGGTYRSDCGANPAPRVTVFEDALVFLDGDQRVAGGNVRSAAGFYGQNMPPEFRTALLSEMPDGSQFIVAVFEDQAGCYITLDGDPGALARIRKPLLTTKFRRCEPGAAKRPPANAPASSDTSVDAGGMLLKPGFRAAYYRALGPRVKEPWLARLDGPSPITRPVTIEGRAYVLVSSCKNHDCAENNTVLLYSPARGVVYGLIHQRGRSSLIGAPPNAVTRQLEKLWKAEWRQTR